MSILSEAFYEQRTADVAKNLLGKTLRYEYAGQILSGRIVETEAYLFNDPGSHAFNGWTARNAPMFGPAGRVYIYRIYGMYLCLNVVTQPLGWAEAVLVRALEPLSGLEIMKQNRKTNVIQALCSGPGKLAQAYDLTLELNNHDFTKPPLTIEDDGFVVIPDEIITATRIGLSHPQATEMKLRYYINNSIYVSRL